ncbi:hypothetical protein [Algoriphagus faecimaris]|nr:hypothetical protein [Algoriphagus faecimaris]
MKTLLIISLMLFGILGQSMAQGCSRELTLVNELLEKANLNQAITDPEAIEEDFNELKSTLSSISLTSLKKDTPRILFLNGKEKNGRVKKNQRQIFVTTLITGKNLSISLQNPMMLHGIEIVICAHSLGGIVQNLTHFTVDESNVMNAFEFQFPDLNGSVVSITVRNIQSQERFDFAIAANSGGELGQENQLSEN